MFCESAAEWDHDRDENDVCRECGDVPRCECNVCQHGVCYACMVGVATGPESHDTCCPSSGRLFSSDGLTVLDEAPVTHRVHVAYDGEHYEWQCSCGRAGSGSGDADLHSDRHINYAAGERRVDTSVPAF